MKYVSINNVQPGMVLANTIYDNNEQVMLRANCKLNDFAINRITDLGYSGLYIFDNDEISISPPVISEESRIKAVKSLKRLDVDSCIYIANDIMEQIETLPHALIETIQLSTKDSYLYTHSVNVCILSVVIGIGLGLGNEELKKLASSALLHDIGKMAIDQQILNKPDKLTSEEYEHVKKHVEFGYNMLKGNNLVSAVAKAGIYEHHENMDGSGYPQGLRGDKIHLFGKIIHVSDVYDALTSKRCYKEAMNPADALEYIMANVDVMFDRQVVQVLIRHVALYPVGATVELSNGHTAVVYSNNPEFLSRPVVKQDDGTLINLLEVNNITVIKLKN